MERLKNEDFETYKKRRSDENWRNKVILRGKTLKYVKGMKLGKQKNI